MPAVTAARVTVIPAKKDRLPINVLSNEARNRKKAYPLTVKDRK